MKEIKRDRLIMIIMLAIMDSTILFMVAASFYAGGLFYVRMFFMVLMVGAAYKFNMLLLERIKELGKSLKS